MAESVSLAYVVNDQRGGKHCKIVTNIDGIIFTRTEGFIKISQRSCSLLHAHVSFLTVKMDKF